ncbi:hypothetical protein JCM3774_003093 [Rhodotorula dairenensis]
MTDDPAVAVRTKPEPREDATTEPRPSPPRMDGTDPIRDGPHGHPGLLHTHSGSNPPKQDEAGPVESEHHLGQRTADPSPDDVESPLFMAHRPRRSFEKGERSTPVSAAGPLPPRQKARARQSAPPSTAALWTSQLSQVTFPGRRGDPASRSHSRSESVPARPDLTPLRIASSPSPTTPPRSRASSRDRSPLLTRASSSRQRVSPSPTSRSSFRLPFLPSIPASPLPPILSPGLTRSASSPPVLPALPVCLPLVPEFASAQPPTSLEDPSARGGWSPSRSHTAEGHPKPDAFAADNASRPSTSASAPNLAIYASAIDEIAAGSYFPTPVTTATSTPGIANADLCFSSTTSSAGLDHRSDAQEQSLSHDEELLVSDDPEEDSTAQAAALAAIADNNRYHALLELVETERGYLEHLRILVKVYFQTLPFLTILTLSEVQAIIRNAEQLLDLHERIAERIEQVEHELGWKRDASGVQDGDPGQAQQTRLAAVRIASVLAEQLPNFALYGEFCSRHAEALDIVRIVAARPEWEAYERQCASRALPDSGETTPVASRANSSVFFTDASPSPGSTSHGSVSSSVGHPSTGSGRPAGASTPVRPALSSSPTVTLSRSAKLRFSDYAIAPVQRVTRYPMLLGQLSKYLQNTAEHDVVRSTCDGFKTMAQAIDSAKREREGELRTRIVASRIEFNTPLVGGAFCDLLGPTLLVGALHVVHYNTNSGPSSTAVYNADPWSSQVPTPSSPVAPAAELVRVKYFGCFLYRSHLVMAKIKKRALYEPREWLPLRLFDIQSVEEGQGLLSHSIAVSFRDHRFELGAICAGEKAVWLSRLLKAQAEARQAWDEQELDEHGQGTLFDDSLVSSIPIFAGSAPKRKTHSRSASSISVASLAMLAPPTPVDGPRLSHDEPVPPIPQEYCAGSETRTADVTPSGSVPSSQPSSPPGGSVLALVSSPQLHSRSRFSSTASSLLLGRTPSSQRAAVDLRLADVFSAECQAARAQAAREADIEATAAILAGKRARTISGPKRSATALSPGSGIGSSSSTLRLLNGGAPLRDGRRMSAAEMSSGVDRSDFDGPIGLDLGFFKDATHPSAGLELLGMTPASTLERERSHKWSNAIRKVHRAGSSGTATMVPPLKTRPPLPEIDTALAQAISRSGSKRAHTSYATPLSAGGTWSRRGQKDRDRHGGLGGQLRRVASHSSLDTDTPIAVARVLRKSPSAASMSPPSAPAVAPVAPTTSTPPNALKAVPALSAEVERNNSVSSTSSSSAGAQSSSSHAQSSQTHETPPSSIPPSPNLAKIDLAAHHGGQSTGSQRTGARSQPQIAPSRPRWSSTMTDGMSGIFRLARRKSTLGLVPPATLGPSPNASDESLTARSSTTTATASDPGGAKLQRRASATISSLFSVKRRNHSSPSLFGNLEESPVHRQARSSSPHLPLSRADVGAAGVAEGGTSAAATSKASALPPSSTLQTPADRTASPQKKNGVGRATSLIRSRSRLLFTAHNGMTPLS